MTVLDPAGGTVGTIDSLANGNAVVATGAHNVALPLASFAMGPKGPIIGMTRAQLDDAAAKAAADAAAALRARMVPGAVISGSQGNVLGTIKEIDGEFIILASADGDARLPAASVVSGPSGLMIGMSAEDLKKALGGSE